MEAMAQPQLEATSQHQPQVEEWGVATDKLEGMHQIHKLFLRQLDQVLQMEINELKQHCQSIKLSG